MAINTDFDIYDGKTYKDLLKDIVTNSELKKFQLNVIITELKDKIKTIDDAIIVAPILQTFLDTSIKNDDQLIKLASIIQKLTTAQTIDPNESNYMTEAEKDKLLDAIKSMEIETTSVN